MQALDAIPPLRRWIKDLDIPVPARVMADDHALSDEIDRMVRMEQVLARVLPTGFAVVKEERRGGPPDAVIRQKPLQQMLPGEKLAEALALAGAKLAGKGGEYLTLLNGFGVARMAAVLAEACDPQHNGGTRLTERVLAAAFLTGASKACNVLHRAIQQLEQAVLAAFHARDAAMLDRAGTMLAEALALLGAPLMSNVLLRGTNIFGGRPVNEANVRSLRREYQPPKPRKPPRELPRIVFSKPAPPKPPPPPPPPSGPTFNKPALQAQTLHHASKHGTPFCEMCQ